MTRIIRITDCRDCPNYAHGGGFGSPAYIPRCNLLPSARNTLPYTTHASGNRVVAQRKAGIPDCCPLEVLTVPTNPDRQTNPELKLALWPKHHTKQHQFEQRLYACGVDRGCTAINLDMDAYCQHAVQAAWVDFVTTGTVTHQAIANIKEI